MPANPTGESSALSSSDESSDQPSTPLKSEEPGMIRLVSVANRLVSASARPLCVGVALAISLMCSVLGFAASTTSTTGMTEMVGASSVSAMSDMGDAVVASVAAAMTVEMGGGGGPTMASMCESPCVTDIGSECAVAAGLAVTTLLALFLASRRDTFLGLLTRVGPIFFVCGRRPELTPWTVPSLSSLCVLRV